MAEILFDEDTRIVEMSEETQDSQRQRSPQRESSSSQKPKSVVVKVPLEKIREVSMLDPTEVSSQRKKELLLKAQQISSKISQEKASRSTEKVHTVPEPHPVPENYNIPKLDPGKDRDGQGEEFARRSRTPTRSRASGNRDDRRGSTRDNHGKEEKSSRRSRTPARSYASGNREDDRSRRRDSRQRDASRSRTPPRRRYGSRESDRDRRRRPSLDRSRSPPRYGRSRSPPFRARWSPPRSWSRFSRSPRRRSPSPRYRRRSPPRRFHDRSFSRSPLRDCGPPPRWHAEGDGFAGARGRGPPWVPSSQPDYSDFQSGPPDYTGFAEHSSQWKIPSQEFRNIPPMMNANVRQTEVANNNVLPLPSDSGNTSTQASLEQFKEQLKGLSQHVLELTSKMSNSTCTKSQDNNMVDVNTVPSGQKSNSTVLPEVSTPSSLHAVASTSKQTEVRYVSKPTLMDEEEGSSESGEDSSEGDSSSEEESDVDSEAASPSLRTPEGLLDWPSLVPLIIAKFPDLIGPEEESCTTTSRVANLGGMVEKRGGDRVKLPMYPPVRKGLTTIPEDIRSPLPKAKSKKDTKPLTRGAFPDCSRGLPVQALSDDSRFNVPAQIDSGVEKLLPPKKHTYNIQGRLTDDNLRKIERDLRINLSSLSYVLWALDFASHNLIQMGESAKKKEDKDSFVPAISAVRHAMSFLSTVLDRSATSMATSMLIRRDAYMAQMDALLPEEDLVKLRCASFLDSTLFAGTVSEITPRLEILRKESYSRESVDVLTNLAKKGVAGSTPKNTSSTGYTSKKKSKKYNKKKSSKKSTVSSGGSGKTTTEQGTGGNITRTFRNKNKKSSNK